ncbi:MAG: hypothetical protein V2I50_02995, partial [Desulfuromusa sp.]|nr:hypothetical protein [Desulfuromusa sp.]
SANRFFLTFYTLSFCQTVLIHPALENVFWTTHRNNLSASLWLQFFPDQLIWYNELFPPLDGRK